MTRTPTIRLLRGDRIDATLFNQLKLYALYDETMPYPSELAKIYGRMEQGEDHRLAHMWVAYDGMALIGVAALEDSFEYALHMYVDEAYRRQGLGERLLLEALTIERPFGAFHTETSKRLYAKYGLIDLCSDSLCFKTDYNPHQALLAQRLATTKPKES